MLPVLCRAVIRQVSTGTTTNIIVEAASPTGSVLWRAATRMENTGTKGNAITGMLPAADDTANAQW